MARSSLAYRPMLVPWQGHSAYLATMDCPDMTANHRAVVGVPLTTRRSHGHGITHAVAYAMPLL